MVWVRPSQVPTHIMLGNLLFWIIPLFLWVIESFLYPQLTPASIYKLKPFNFVSNLQWDLLYPELAFSQPPFQTSGSPHSATCDNLSQKIGKPFSLIGSKMEDSVPVLSLRDETNILQSPAQQQLPFGIWEVERQVTLNLELYYKEVLTLLVLLINGIKENLAHP